MAKKLLKLIITTDRKQVAYCYMPNCFSDLDSAIKNVFPEQSDKVFRKSWFDEDNDRIYIVNQESYEIFISKATEMTIYLENVKSNFITIIEGQENSSLNSIEKAYHVGITCDECLEATICGYRYMCIECDNYDICMECEAKMKHSDHIMIRVANPIDSTFATKLIRKIRKAIKLPHVEKFHSRRYHRGHRSVFNSFHTMMNDLADADIPEEQPKAFATSAKPNQNKKWEKKKKQNPKCSRTSARYLFPGGARIPRVEIPIIDIPPIYYDNKFGLQITRNFSKIFEKMLDPNGGSADDGSDKRDNKNNKQGNKAENSETPMEEVSAQTPTTETNKSVSKNNTTKEQKSVTIVEPSSRSDSESPDYDVLRQQLLQLIEKEEETAAPTASSPATSVAHKEPEAPAPPVETRQYQIVYHKKKHINDAIIAMMSMGFNNENQWLTHLLDSVNGNIGKALDLLKPAQ